MENFDKLFNKVSDFIDRDEVIDNEEVISAYTLWNLMQKEIDKINYVEENNKEFIDYLNKHYKELYKNSIFTGSLLYNKAIENFKFKKKIIGPIKFERITSFSAGLDAVFNFVEFEFKHSKEATLIRKDSDGSYYGDRVNSYLVGISKDYLDDIFCTLENVPPLHMYDMHVNNGVFDINISENSVIVFSKEVDPNNNQYKKYVDAPYTISEYLNHPIIKESILKRTSVKVNELEPFCKGIIERNMDDIINHSVKVYEKK